MKIILETYYGHRLMATHEAVIHPVPGIPTVIQIDVDPRAIMPKQPLHQPPLGAYNSRPTKPNEPATEPTKGRTMSRRSERRKARMDAGTGMLQRFLDPENEHPILKNIWQSLRPILQQVLTQAIAGLVLAMDACDVDDDETPPQRLG